MASATGAAGPQVQRGVLIQQGGLSPRVQTFLCCNGEGGEDPHFFVLPASAMEEAVEKVRAHCANGQYCSTAVCLLAWPAGTVLRLPRPPTHPPVL